jgi:hypothetical protein
MARTLIIREKAVKYFFGIFAADSDGAGRPAL